MSRSKGTLTVWVMLLAVVLSSSGCGYLLYPDRRTQELSTRKDGTVIVLDCLWLLAGIVPGVVALAVDGINDTWCYTKDEVAEMTSNGRLQAMMPRGEELAVRLHGSPPPDSVVTLCLSDDRGVPLATSTAMADPTVDGQIVSVRVPETAAASDGRLVLAVNGNPQLTWDVKIVD